MKEELMKEKKEQKVECKGEQLKIHFFSVTILDRVDPESQAI